MGLTPRIEAAIAEAVQLGQGRGPVPPRLSSALGYATAPGGARIRPTLSLIHISEPTRPY